MSWRTRIFCGVVGVAGILGCGGCALIPLGTLSTVLGIGSTVASTGPEVYHAGKLDSAVFANYPSTLAAVRDAAGDLGLHVTYDEPACKCDDARFFKLRDDRKTEIQVTVERRAAMLCRCQVDVGWFGSEPTAKLLANQIESHLPERARAATRGD
jgi:hypothetical protein